MIPAEIKALIRTVPDFPAPGILFRDITTLIAHPEGLEATIDHLVEAARLTPKHAALTEALGTARG